MIFAEKISKEDLKDLPLLRYEGEIHVVEKPNEVWKHVRQIRKEKLVGFDTEKKPTFKKGQFHPTALLQFATPAEAFLFRINKIGFHTGIKEILQDDTIRKIGLGLKDDIQNLVTLENFQPGGFLDLISITRELGIKQTGLRNLAAIILDKRVSKNQQTSNWENDQLTESQQQYAALDAGLCLDIYLLLQQKGYI